MYYSTFLFKFVLYLSAVLMSSRRSAAQRVSVTFLSNLDKSSITVADTVYFQLISFFSLLYLWFIAQVPKTRLEPSWAYLDRRKVSKFEGANHNQKNPIWPGSLFVYNKAKFMKAHWPMGSDVPELCLETITVLCYIAKNLRVQVRWPPQATYETRVWSEFISRDNCHVVGLKCKTDQQQKWQ